MGFGAIGIAVQFSASCHKYLEYVREKICRADQNTLSVFV